MSLDHELAPFALFGMGARRKLLYRQGALCDAQTGEVLERVEVAEERFYPEAYRLEVLTQGGTLWRLEEDEAAVWLEHRGERRPLTASPLRLPAFGGHPYAAELRVLHHEVLVNIVGGRPLPNFFVYPKPWYRDAATVAMVLERTGNLSLIADWVGGLREPFDRNNAGHREPDNLGQALYLVSLLGDPAHPLVDEVVRAAQEFQRGRHLCGLSDFAEHPVYQTKWMKFGLRRLGLDDPYVIPEVYDSYSSLFWWGFCDQHVPGPPFEERLGRLYPYLAWAEAHFHRANPPLALMGTRYPLSWEAEASQADYQGMCRVGEEYAAQRVATPHTWHAGEMFLYLIEREGEVR